jgi:hypothetical protein
VLQNCKLGTTELSYGRWGAGRDRRAPAGRGWGWRPGQAHPPVGGRAWHPAATSTVDVRRWIFDVRCMSVPGLTSGARPGDWESALGPLTPALFPAIARVRVGTSSAGERGISECGFEISDFRWPLLPAPCSLLPAPCPLPPAPCSLPPGPWLQTAQHLALSRGSLFPGVRRCEGCSSWRREWHSSSGGRPALRRTGARRKQIQHAAGRQVPPLAPRMTTTTTVTTTTTIFWQLRGLAKAGAAAGRRRCLRGRRRASPGRPSRRCGCVARWCRAR